VIRVMLLCLILYGGTAAAQQQDPQDVSKLSLEDLMKVKVPTVYGASKFEQKVTEAPSFITIITSDEIQRYGYRTFADVLRSVPGLFVTYDRNYSYIGTRGFMGPGSYNDRILIQIDGHRLNENIYDGAYIETEFPLDIDLIERVEVIRGPGSALYGTDAFFAVINVITKRGGEYNAAEISGDAGSLNTYRGRVTYGMKSQRSVEWLLSGSYYHSQGNTRLFYPEFNFPETNNGYAMNADGDRFGSLFGSLEYHGLRLEGAYVSRDKVVPTAPFGSIFNDPQTNTLDSNAFLDLSYDRVFANHWELLARLSYDRYFYHGVYVNDSGTGLPPYVLNEDYSEGRWWTAQIDVSRTFFEKHHITVGTEERINTKQDQWNYDLQPYDSHLNDHRSSVVAAIYAQDEYRIRPDLILSAGLRYDHYQTFGGSFNPRLALIYRPWERTAFKLIYGQAFRAPNVFELYYADQISEEGNAKLQPESVKTTELIYEQYFLKRAHLAVSGFYNSSNGLIDLVTNPVDNLLQFQNSENVIGKGIEFELGGEWANGWKARLADTIQESYNSQNRANEYDSPRQLPKINLIAPLPWRKLFVGVEGQYITRMMTTQGTNLGGFLIANATLSTPELFKGLSVSFSVYNLFDKHYAYPANIGDTQASIPQNLRGLRLKLTYRFPKWPRH
jgi:outer membrane receptor for ferrienterochelin and colicins